jgi:adenine phosphoribosyltransferase
MNTNLFRKSLLNASIIQKQGYSYLIHPLLDGIPQIDPLLLSDVIELLKKQINPFLPVDKLVTIEAMGIPIASVLCSELDIPCTIIRKRSYGFADERKVTQHTGYATNTLYINGIKKGESVVLIDDVISTGGTIKSVLNVLDRMQITVKGVFILVDKGDNLKRIQTETNIPISALETIKIIDNKITIVE